MDNIRTESFLGSDKVIVGNKYTDLVLETLGKVYIKTGNNSRVLSDVLALLDKATESEIKSQTIIVGSLLEMEQMEYPGDGFFIYNTLTTTLYISYDERYIALIEAAEGAGDGYVRRKGDTMTGQLEINTVGPPLIVASSKLVSNLNVEYINGYASDDLAKKKIDEYIYGNWTFKGKGVSEGNWVFKDDVRMYGDLITNRSITSPEFASGFGGYGWRLDADTNTLTIDYLVVRKAMRVYELVINKINATNGSIWVSNSSKCSTAVQPTILTDLELKSIPSWTGSIKNKEAALKILKSGTYYLPIPSNGANTESIVSFTTELSGPSRPNTTSRTFANYKFIIYIKDPIGLVNNPLFRGLQSLYDESLLTSNSGDDNHTQLQKCIVLYYISKEMTVTEWGGSNGQEPVSWKYIDTFDKEFAFYMIPKGIHSSGSLYTELYENASSQEDARKYVFAIYPYYKYFALEKSIVDAAIAESNAEFNNGYVPTTTVPNLWVVNTDDKEYPLFKPGDIIRCQKYTEGNIKYYDAIVLAQIESRQFIVQKATQAFDKYTEIHYNEDGSVNEYIEKYNTTQYSKTERSYSSTTGRVESNSESKTVEARVDNIASGDDMVQMGNIYNPERQNAIYLTSCDDDGPFIDVISGLNRPDYSVLYDIPKYRRKEIVYESTKKNYYLQKEYVAGAPSIIETVDGTQATLYGTKHPTSTSLFQIKDKKYRHSYTKTTKVRVGNLDGIYNEIFGDKQPYGFGLYGENVFLTGEFYLNNGTSIVDFSEDKVLLKFKMAGLAIRDVDPVQQVPVIGLDGKPVLDKDGNQVYQNKTEIYMNADQFRFSIGGRPAMSLSGLFNNETGQILDTFLDVQGWIQTNGLYIYPKGFENDPNYPEIGASCYIDEYGYFYANNAVLSGTVVATAGYIGGSQRTITQSALSSLKRYPYCKAISVQGNLLNVFSNPNSPTDLTLSNGIKFNSRGELTVYYGGFEIANSYIISNTIVDPGITDPNGSYGDYGKFTLYSSDSSYLSFAGKYIQAMIGLNTLPSISGYRALGRFEDTSPITNPGEKRKIGLMLDISSNSRSITSDHSIYNIRGNFSGFSLSTKCFTKEGESIQWDRQTNVILFNRSKQTLVVPRLPEGYDGRILFIKLIHDGPAYVQFDSRQPLNHSRGDVTDKLEIGARGDAMILVYKDNIVYGPGQEGSWHQFKCPRDW